MAIESKVPPAIPLNQAMLCLSCDMVYAGDGLCPGCGERFNWPVAQWLTRPQTAAERSYRELRANEAA